MAMSYRRMQRIESRAQAMDSRERECVSSAEGRSRRWRVRAPLRVTAMGIVRSTVVVAALMATGIACTPAMASYNSGPKTLLPIYVMGFTGFLNINSPDVQFGQGPTGLHGTVAYSPTNTAPTAKSTQDKNGCANRTGDPIEISSGAKVETHTL